MVIAITRSNYIKRLPVPTYREQRRGGIGVMGMDLKEDDYIEHLFVASTHDYVLFFTNVGQGLPAQGARAAARLAPVEGARDPEPAAVPPGRAGARRRPDARLRGGEVPGLRDEERHRQEDRASRPTTRRSRRTGSSRSRCARATSSSRRAPLDGRRRHPHGLAQGPGDPLQRAGRPADGTRHRGRQGHAASQGRRGDRGQHRRRTTPTCSS